MLNNIKFLFIVLMLGACSQGSNPLGKPLPTLSYENLQPYSPWRGAVDVRQNFKPSARAVEGAKGFSIPPDELLQQYVHRRFITNGKPLRLIFDIRNATVIKKTEAENMIGFLSGASQDTYILSYSISMIPIDVFGQQSEPFTINLKRELFIPHRSSLSEREHYQFEFLEKAIHDIDKIISEMYISRMR